MFKKRGKILVAMSGGVDSSVAALLLKQAGHDVTGVSLHLYSCNRIGAKSCCSAKDRLDARKVCEGIGIPFVSLDYRDAFKSKVIQPFIDEYQRGRTPSPCILCNRHLKFEALLGEAERLGAEVIATGHYARIEPDILRAKSRSEYHLLRGLDKKKDQSYFLFTLSQEQLKRIIFPVGGMTKQEVRMIAKEHGLPTSEKQESQEICFVPDDDYASFVEEVRPSGIKGPGNFVGIDGKILGRHKGIHNYTIGQRRGLGFGVGERQYVVRIDAEDNRVVLGSNDDLLRSEMVVRDVHWITGGGVRDLQVQIRSTHKASKANIEFLTNDEARVSFKEPQRAIAPGQAAVFYDGDEVLGGGWIV